MKKVFTYENKMVAICMLCFGFAMFDRFAITNLSPYIMEDLSMTNAQLGQVISVFALAWAFSGFFGSILSDITANKKKMLGVFVLLFSACSFLTGLAWSFAMLVLIRMVMGLFEGPMFPLLQAFSLAQSSVKRRGLNMGLISSTSMGLIANLIGPILLVALCEVFGWRVTFFYTMIPGVIIAWLVFRVLREPDMTKIEGATQSPFNHECGLGEPGADCQPKRPTVRESLVVLKNRNVRTSMVFGCFLICWNVGTLAFAPVYLVSVKGFSMVNMSFIMAAFGVGAVVWGMVVPSLSDRYGRKPIIILFTLLSIVSPLGLLLASSPLIIWLCIFVGWSGSGVFALYQAAILGESVDTKFASTAMASVQMVGELGGAVVGVAIAGILADEFGLPAALVLAACCTIAAALVALRYTETAPLVLARRSNKL